MPISSECSLPFGLHVAKLLEVNHCIVLVCKTELERPLRRHKHRWEDNIKMDLTEVECEVVDCVLNGPVKVPRDGVCESGSER
jgi:hypothetical protein